MNWVLLSLGVILFSIINNLSFRKAKEDNLSGSLQKLANSLLPSLFILVMLIFDGESFVLNVKQVIILIIAAVFFSWLGVTFFIRAIKFSPNPGYPLIISKSYVVMNTILAVWLFDSSLTIKKLIAILIILLFFSLIIIEKKKKAKQKVKQGWILYAFVAFFAFGFNALSNKYLIDDGLQPQLILFYKQLFVGIITIFEIIFAQKSVEFHIPKKGLFTFLLIGISSMLFNLFMNFGYKYAPNPGYVSAVNSASVALVAIFSTVIFGDKLNVRKFIGIIGVVAGLILLFLSN